MKQGIHLGPPLGRATRVARAALWILVAATALNVLDVWRARARVEALRSEVTEARARLASIPEDASGGGAAIVASRLKAFAASGLLDSHAPTVLLGLLERSRPAGLTLTSVSLRPGPKPSSILVEARAEADAALTEFQRRLDASPLVAATEVVEERRTPGALSIRLEASLVPR